MKEEKEDLFSTRLKDAIAAMKPVRPVGRPRKVTPPIEPEQEEQDATPFDIWDGPPPLPVEEQFRLARVDLPFGAHIAGEFRLKPGATPTTITQMLEAALDGRANTIENLQKLFRHMSQSYSNGGVALASGALYEVPQRTLKEANALDESVMPKRYNFLEELQKRV